MSVESLTAEQKLNIARTFNEKPEKGVAVLLDIDPKSSDWKQQLTDKMTSPDEQVKVAKFLMDAKPLLDPLQVGDYLGDGTKTEGAKNKEVLAAYTSQIKLNDMGVVPALRTYLKNFELPGEGQKVDRIMDAFGVAFIAQNPNSEINAPEGSKETGLLVATREEAASVLAYGVIGLGTDLHNPAVKVKKTQDEFRKPFQGKEYTGCFNDKLLNGLYDEVASAKIGTKSVVQNPTIGFKGQVFGDSTKQHEIKSMPKEYVPTTAKPTSKKTSILVDGQNVNGTEYRTRYQKGDKKDEFIDVVVFKPTTSILSRSNKGQDNSYTTIALSCDGGGIPHSSSLEAASTIAGNIGAARVEARSPEVSALITNALEEKKPQLSKTQLLGTTAGETSTDHLPPKREGETTIQYNNRLDSMQAMLDDPQAQKALKGLQDAKLVVDKPASKSWVRTAVSAFRYGGFKR